jgi:2-phosphoglycerate kinase
MFNVCSNCGIYTVEKEIVDTANDSFAKCPACGHMHKFKKLPLVILTGASGSGKSAVTAELTRRMTRFVVLEKDILWSDYFSTLSDHNRTFNELWLRVAKNVGQNGKPVMLCGSFVPGQMESCSERRYFSELCFGALVCDNRTLTERLMKRPEWRNSGSEEFINEHNRFNEWFRHQEQTSNNTLVLFDTSYNTIEETADEIIKWLDRMLPVTRFN